MKAPKVNVKDILKALGFLRNNLALLIPIVIVIVALLLFISSGIVGRRLRTKVQKESVQMGKRVDTLARDVNSAVEAEALESYISAYAQDANEIEQLGIHATQRELLSYELFPDTNETSMLLFERFGQRYRLGVETLIASLNAGLCPNDAEIDAVLEAAPRPQRGIGRGGRSRGGMMGPGRSGRGRSYRMMTDSDRKIIDNICLEKAKTMAIFATPASIAGYPYWDTWVFENRDKAYQDCWYWQLGYWIIEDVVGTVREVNAGSDSVLTSPVKRLMNVDFTLQRMRMSSMGGRRGRARTRKKEGTEPSYVTNTKDGMTTPCTGRYSDDAIDVVHFNIRVVIRSADVMAFMQNLCTAKEHTFRGWYGNDAEVKYLHNPISVLEHKEALVDPQGYEHELHYYGGDSVVELDLICEYLFNKPAYAEIVPPVVTDALLGEEGSS